MPYEPKQLNELYVSLLATTPMKARVIEETIRLPQRLHKIIEAVKADPDSKIFLKRVSKKEAPDYYTIIKEPMDLNTVHRKLLKYKNYQEFKYDLDLIWNNCLTYNTTKYYRDCATNMRALVGALEVQPTPVSHDLDFEYTSIQVLGQYYIRPLVKSTLKKIICAVLKSVGFYNSCTSCLDIIADVLNVEMQSFVLKVTESSRDN